MKDTHRGGLPSWLRKIRSELGKVKGRFFFYCEQIQKLKNYVLFGILDIEKDNRPQGGLPSLVKKNPLRTRQSRGAVFLCLGYLQY